MDIEAGIDLGAVYSALANDTRREILELLKHPEVHFESERYRDLGLDLADGVCVQDIQRAAGISQSVTSGYLKMLQNAGFLTSYREGRWTYYRRDEAAIREIAARMRAALAS
ncbi:Transcriptional regulator, ArsR family [Leucobacter sp. 7(1)]|uniref:ArsR/SmtB family transcription factor n=1 Tax=Leucobacter sp. 7(1) TaxID=1255613 RepID=UPI00097F199B|nr:metalloregulator ArsR/SmtB family transcription factor [Leucobacter sp. 7(1)]SJN12696.1 Transcriptional regulator, ArsR family [Leucobacter sp. 7(1)]